MEKFKESYKEPLYGNEDHRVDLPETFKIICCPNCANEVPAVDLNINDKIGKCGSCQGVFSIEKDIQDLQQGPHKIKQEILRPEGIELFEFKDELEISFEQPKTWVEWTLMILLALFLIAGIGASLENSTIVPFLALSVVPSVLAYLYYLRRKAKHRKFILIDDDYLDIMWRPRNFKTNKRYAINDISQMYVKHSPDLGDWRVCMILDEGQGQKHIELTSVNTATKAKFLEQVIESHLNIQDVIVPEES